MMEKYRTIPFCDSWFFCRVITILQLSPSQLLQAALDRNSGNHYLETQLDAATWTKIGSVLQMAYTLPHFMGYRFGLFNFETKTAGGFVDFDFFHVNCEISAE